MTRHIANDHAFLRDVQQPTEPLFARDNANRTMGMRARVLIACALSAIGALLVSVLWLSGPDWKKLLLFCGIVGIAAMGGRRAAPVAASRHVQDAPQLAGRLGPARLHDRRVRVHSHVGK